MTDLHTWSETAGSNNSASPSGAPEGMLPGGLNNTIREIMGASVRAWNRDHPTISSATSTTAYTLTYTTAPPALVQGLRFVFKVHATSTGAVTVNPNSLGATAVKRNIAGTLTQVTTGEWVTNDIVSISYDSSASCFIWENAVPAGFLGAANTWTAAQTVSLAAAGAALTLKSSDAGAGEGPSIDLYRDSASPAASDIIGAVNYQGEDSAGNTEVYAKTLVTIKDATSTSENAQWAVQTVEGGSLANRIVVGGTGGGVQIGNPTSNDMGAGTINVEGSASLFGSYVAGKANGLILLSTLTASSSAALDFTATNSTVYSGYLLIFDQILAATDNVDLWLRFSTDGGSSFLTTSTYAHGRFGVTSAPATGNGGGAGDSKIILASGVSNTATAGYSGHVLINQSTAANGVKATALLAGYQTGTVYTTWFSGGVNSNSSINASRILMSSGNITSGTIRVYGIPKA